VKALLTTRIFQKSVTADYHFVADSQSGAGGSILSWCKHEGWGLLDVKPEDSGDLYMVIKKGTGTIYCWTSTGDRFTRKVSYDQHPATFLKAIVGNYCNR
jgi:hypothetical protein